ncbi:MAG TPA: hypothetical protein VGM57_05775 [Pseudolabrys sp.]
MKKLAGVLAIMFALSGFAAGQGTSPLTPAEQDYIAARDAAIATIKKLVDAPKPDNDAISAADDKALAGLEAKLRTIVGPVSIAGYGDAKSNLDTLQQEMGFGYLDGLVVRSPDSTSSFIVTTEPLFMAWLRGHKNWWEKSAPMPQDIAAAVRTEAFYTQAISTDSAMVSYGTVPVKKPDGATFAFAILGARTQDLSPPAPDQMFVTLVKGSRVFVANVPLAQAIEPDPSCAALRESFRKRAEKLYETDRAGGTKDETLTDRAGALENEGDEKQRQCVGEKMTAEQRAAVVKQAQTTIDGMAK